MAPKKFSWALSGHFETKVVAACGWQLWHWCFLSSSYCSSLTEGFIHRFEENLFVCFLGRFEEATDFRDIIDGVGWEIEVFS